MCTHSLQSCISALWCWFGVYVHCALCIEHAGFEPISSTIFFWTLFLPVEICINSIMICFFLFSLPFAFWCCIFSSVFKIFSLRLPITLKANTKLLSNTIDFWLLLCCAANVQVANLMSVCTHLYSNNIRRFKQSPEIFLRTAERENTQVDEMHACFAYGYTLVFASREGKFITIIAIFKCTISFDRQLCCLWHVFVCFRPTEINENQKYAEKRGEIKVPRHEFIC